LRLATFISAIALQLSMRFCAAGSQQNAMWRPSGAMSNTSPSGSMRGSS
jgi:hypothetical protein